MAPPGPIDCTQAACFDGRVSFAQRLRLPHTDLEVSRIGLGSSFGVPAEGLELAFERGINFFYWGSVRRPGFGEGIRRLARHHREQMAVVIQSYARWPAASLTASVELGLRRLGLDHADVLLLGWYNSRPSQAILDAALELRARGRVRHLMMSGHERSFFPEMAKEDLFDLFMVRYNAVHRGAEQEVLPALPGGAARPAICAYTATCWGSLLDASRMPAGERTPQASDCYRFCLSQPGIDMVLCGPAKIDHVLEALTAIEAGPLSAEELAWMRRVGDHLHGSSRARLPFA